MNGCFVRIRNYLYILICITYSFITYSLYSSTHLPIYPSTLILLSRVLEFAIASSIVPSPYLQYNALSFESGFFQTWRPVLSCLSWFSPVSLIRVYGAVVTRSIVEIPFWKLTCWAINISGSSHPDFFHSTKNLLTQETQQTHDLHLHNNKSHGDFGQTNIKQKSLESNYW